MKPEGKVMSKSRICQNSGECSISGLPVWGSGPRNSQIMIVGEAPGRWEDKYGKPFVGKSGKELDNYLEKFAGVSRDVCFVTNIVLCRPDAKDREPRPGEIEICTETFLKRDIIEIEPRFIIAAGGVAAGFFLGPVKMEMVHGIGYKWEGLFIETVVIPVYHPSYGLHSTRKMRFIQEDFQMVGEIIRGRGDVREWVVEERKRETGEEFDYEDEVGVMEGVE